MFVFEGRCYSQACKECEHLVTISSGFKAAVVGNGHKAAAFLHSQVWFLGQQSLSGTNGIQKKASLKSNTEYHVLVDGRMTSRV